MPCVLPGLVQWERRGISLVPGPSFFLLLGQDQRFFVRAIQLFLVTRGPFSSASKVPFSDGLSEPSGLLALQPISPRY